MEEEAGNSLISRESLKAYGRRKKLFSIQWKMVLWNVKHVSIEWQYVLGRGGMGQAGVGGFLRQKREMLGLDHR